jgi:hypothetical protein
LTWTAEASFKVSMIVHTMRSFSHLKAGHTSRLSYATDLEWNCLAHWNNVFSNIAWTKEWARWNTRSQWSQVGGVDPDQNWSRLS